MKKTNARFLKRHLLSSPSTQYLTRLNLAMVFLSFALFFPQVLRNFLCHTSLILPVVSGFFDSFRSFLIVCVFVPFTQLYIFLLFLIFPLLHWHTGFSDNISLFFLSSIPLVSCTLPFHSFCLQTLPLFFPLSLSAYSSYILRSLCNVAFLCPLLAPFSNIFFALSCSFHRQTSAPYINTLVLSIMLSNIIIFLLKSPPHFFLSYSPNTSHYLICLPHYFSDMCLIRDSFIECVTQVFEPV
jgi:hypothetical protein